MLFISNSECGVDARGRTSIPATFRDVLGTAKSVFLFPSPRDGCIEGGGLPLMQGYVRQAQKLRPQDPKKKALEHFIIGRTIECAYDSTGRAVLDEKLRAHAGITDRARFVGLGRYFQIWNPVAHDAYLASIEEVALEGLDMLDPFDEPFGEVA